MDCPLCRGATKVVDSRRDDDGVRRRRECLECGYRFNTMEFDYDQYQQMTIGQCVSMRVNVRTFRSGIEPVVSCELI